MLTSTTTESNMLSANSQLAIVMKPRAKERNINPPLRVRRVSESDPRRKWAVNGRSRRERIGSRRRMGSASNFERTNSKLCPVIAIKAKTRDVARTVNTRANIKREVSFSLFCESWLIKYIFIGSHGTHHGNSTGPVNDNAIQLYAAECTQDSDG